MSVLEKLGEIENKYEELSSRLSDPSVINDRDKYQKYTKSYSDLGFIVSKYREYQKILSDLSDAKEMLNTEYDPEMKKFAKDEITRLQENEHELMDQLKLLLVPKDPNDEKNVVLEIRAGTGGDEATLFAQEIFRMYSRFAEIKGWKIEILEANITGVGGFKEVIAMIEGNGVYSELKYESGVHRVQRVPATEASGRVHTSAVTVAVLPEAEEVDVDIDEADLRIDRFCSSGPGGQSVNTTMSAIRITHLPTGLVVSCQDEKSQHKNKAQALRVLRSRLLDLKIQEQHDERAANRKQQVGSGDRSQKIRTYNFPQNRVTDHRIGLTLHKLDTIMEGQLKELVESLNAYFRAESINESITTA